VVAQGNPHVPVLVSYPPLSVLASALTLEELLLAVDHDFVIVSSGVNRKLVSAVNEFPHGIPPLVIAGSNVAPALEKKTN
jgi:hypothetical protein